MFSFSNAVGYQYSRSAEGIASRTALAAVVATKIYSGAPGPPEAQKKKMHVIQFPPPPSELAAARPSRNELGLVDLR